MSSQESVSLTADLWISAGNDAYLGVTSHFVDRSWTLNHYLLGAFELNHSHTSDNIKDLLFSVLDDYGITGKVHVIVTDNARNIRTACSSRNIQNLTCFGRNVNLAIKAGIEQQNVRISNLLAKCRKIVGQIRMSPTDY